MSSQMIPRRAFLRGIGTAMALPALPSLGAVGTAGKTRPVGAVTASGEPLRMGFVYLPNGLIMDKFTPKTTGADYALSQTLKPLEGVRNHLQVISGLAHEKAQANGDGGGDHARANATFLTGMQARKTSGRDIRLGVSVDQVAAQRLGHLTPMASLELGTDAKRTSGSCDSGYSCAYQFNLSWRDAHTPAPPESNPRDVFDRLFTNSFLGDMSDHPERRMKYHKSVLDFVLDDAKRMERRLDAGDRRKLDEYLTSVREVERRIEHAESFQAQQEDGQFAGGIPKDYGEHMRLMYDLQVLAWQTDMTRIGTFLTAHDGSNRRFREVGVNHGHHELSHHREDPKKIADIERIDAYYMQHLAYFLQRLSDTPDGESGSSLLDNSMIVVGSGISDANRHRHNELPVLLAGKGGGTLNPGRHWRAGKDVPMTNLFLSLLDRMGAPVDRLGDSTGPLAGI